VLNRKPVAYLVCNQSPPGADGTPSLMTFRDVEILFHEVSKFLFKKLEAISNLSRCPRFSFVHVITAAVGTAPDCCAGGRGFEPQTGATLRVLK